MSVIASDFIIIVLLYYYYVALESTTASTRRLSLVTHDTRISPYISKSNNVLFKFV